MNLSDGARRIDPMRAHPWKRLADDWPQIHVLHEDLGPHRMGSSRWLAGRPVGIVLHRGLSQVERRCVLAHELEHFDRGQPCATLRASIEARVLRDTARYLLPDLDEIAKALATYDSLYQSAAELWVTFPVLVDRLNGLTDAESEYVHR